MELFGRIVPLVNSYKLPSSAKEAKTEQVSVNEALATGLVKKGGAAPNVRWIDVRALLLLFSELVDDIYVCVAVVEFWTGRSGEEIF